MFIMLFRSCPPYLEASLTRAVLDEAKAHYLAEKGQDQVDATGLPQNAKGDTTFKGGFSTQMGKRCKPKKCVLHIFL